MKITKPIEEDSLHLLSVLQNSFVSLFMIKIPHVNHTFTPPLS
jgi:hypothetical protein